MTGRLAGKVALITGAGCIGPGWGNGRAAAVFFAREGAKVFAVDNNPDAMTETVARVGSSGEIATHVCDVTEDAQVRAMADACRITPPAMRHSTSKRRWVQKCSRVATPYQSSPMLTAVGDDK